MRRYDTVIFDMDGTLLDTLGDIQNAVNAAMRKVGCPERSRKEIRSFVGNGMTRLLQCSLPSEAAGRMEEAVEAFLAFYKIHCRDLTKPYPDIMALVQELHCRGLRLAIVSNKPDAEVKALCEEFFEGLFLYASGECEGMRRKPAPDMVLHSMEVLGACPGRTLYVGDSEVDVCTARNAGVACAAVTWGFRSEAQLKEAGAELFVHDPMELLDIVDDRSSC